MVNFELFTVEWGQIINARDCVIISISILASNSRNVGKSPEKTIYFLPLHTFVLLVPLEIRTQNDIGERQGASHRK